MRLSIGTILLLVVIGFGFNGCNWFNGNKPSSHTVFDFSDSTKISSDISAINTGDGIIRIAVAAITSPRETFSYYREMFRFIEEQTGLSVVMTQRKTYDEINGLMRNGEIDIAFVCSGGYVFGLADSSFNLLVVPERNGKRTYQTYIITHKDSEIKKFEDFRQRRFALTDPLSTSGNLYPQRKLKDLGTNANDFFYSHIFTYAHDNSIQLVAKQMVDGAAVNSLVYDYLLVNSPERVANIKIIETSGWYGIPPVIASKNLPNERRVELKNIFLNMHNDEKSRQVLKKLMYDRFVLDDDTIFNSVRVLMD